MSYDKIISIEMFEAVGKKNWNNYFKILNRSLKKGAHDTTNYYYK